ncbi:MAG: cysteine desulfurase family protein [Polyangia bacterium]
MEPGTRRIYLDHNATTPLHPEVMRVMIEALSCFGNPSSQHIEGQRARGAVEAARREVAALLGCSPFEVVFTSGGTESNNTAILGAARARARAGIGGDGPWQVIAGPLEHPSVRRSLEVLRGEGFRVTVLPVDAAGRLDAAALEQVLGDGRTALVTVQLCSHELGNLNPIAELSARARAHGAWFHCDAVQGAGKVPLDVRALGVDLLSVSAHKLYGPKGIGALFVRGVPVRTEGSGAATCGVPLDLPALLVGGSQEKGRRAGTENVPGILGFGRAARLAREELLGRAAEVAALRDRLESQLLQIPGARRHGEARSEHRAPATCNLGFAGVTGELLMMGLDLRGAAVSTGSACSSGSPEPSVGLLALGLSREQALEAVRFSLGLTTTAEDVDQVAAWVREIVEHVRRLGSEGSFGKGTGCVTIRQRRLNGC